MVAATVFEYGHLVCEEKNDLLPLLFSAYFHDSIEDILDILAGHIGQTVERDTILKTVWGNNSYANSLALNVQITYIRKMLAPDTTVSIVSLKKRGYILEVNKNILDDN